MNRAQAHKDTYSFGPDVALIPLLLPFENFICRVDYRRKFFPQIRKPFVESRIHCHSHIVVDPPAQAVAIDGLWKEVQVPIEGESLNVGLKEHFFGKSVDYLFRRVAKDLEGRAVILLPQPLALVEIRAQEPFERVPQHYEAPQSIAALEPLSRP